MKKIILVILILTLLTACSCGITSETSASDVMAKVTSKEALIGDAATYIDCADESSENYIAPEDLGYLYYNEKSAPEELSCIESYCIQISKTKQIGEIHIFRVRYQSDTNSVIRMLNRRAALLCKSEINPNESAFFAEKAPDARVFSRGKFVFLIAGENIDKMESAIKRNT